MIFFRATWQVLFTICYTIVIGLTFVFVYPWVLLSERLARPKKGKLVGVVAMLIVGASLLTGCTVSSTNSVGRVFDKAGLAVDRATEFAATAPDAPYKALRSAEDFTDAMPQDFVMTAEQIALTEGAGKIAGVSPVLVAYTVEKELRALDSGELERDVVSALTGENTSIGIAQVRLSTADEIEKLDDADLFPDPDPSDQARTERIRRLAADDWSILYSAAYLAILESRHPGETELELAQRYTGRTPGNASQSDEDLFQQMTELFE